jgi:hypothetical protein
MINSLVELFELWVYRNPTFPGIPTGAIIPYHF